MVCICRLRLFNRFVVYEHFEHDRRRRTFEVIDDLFWKQSFAVDETWHSLSTDTEGIMAGTGNNSDDDGNGGGGEYWSKRFRKNASWYRRNDESDGKSNGGGGGWKREENRNGLEFVCWLGLNKDL